MKIRWLLGGAALLILGILLIKTLQAPSPMVSSKIDLQQALSDESGNFAPVTPGRDFSFPKDHGAHPEYKTEWWYFTGNLETNDGERFGYQLTLFRVGLGQEDRDKNSSQWSTDSIMMGHLGLSQANGKNFFTFERFARCSLGLAGIQDSGEKIWLEDWTIQRSDSSWKLQAATTTSDGKNLKLDLDLRDSKPPVLQGQGGYSLKGPEAKHASYYVSQTRLGSSGSISLGGQEFQVRGDSWFDHEWSSEAMAPGLVGWDWFSLQLSDNTELMLYLLRYEDGRLEPASSGSLVDSDGHKTNLKLEQFQVKKLADYTSKTGVLYPSEWQIEIPEHDVSIKVKPVIPDQEMLGAVPYWEGAVDVVGTRGTQNLEGRGFVELTGY